MRIGADHLLLLILVGVTFCLDIGRAQNIVAGNSAILPANPAKLTETDFSEFIFSVPQLGNPFSNSLPASERVRERLTREVERWLSAPEWMPFHHTLGISGYETYFTHPDDLYYTLSLSLPWLPQAAAQRVKTRLKEGLSRFPPYAVPGFNLRSGQARESYDVPGELRASGQSQATSLLGIYSFWAYCHYARDVTAARDHWPAVAARLQVFLAAPYAFDPYETSDRRDDEETLNGDIAGLIGAARLARINGKSAMEEEILRRGRQLLEWRVNLDLVNPVVLKRSHFSTKALHNYKLARYNALVPELGRCLDERTQGLSAARLREFRSGRSGWFLAFGDRLVGGENYTNPLHFVRSLFVGAVLMEKQKAETLVNWLDVPWCAADLSYLEKCALTLWVASGRPWEPWSP